MSTVENNVVNFLSSNNTDFIFSTFRNIILLITDAFLMSRTLVLKKCESDDKLAAMQVN